jgi:uncharacterized membrane protein
MHAEQVTSTRASLRWLIPAVAVVVFAIWLVNTPHGLLGKADAVAYSVCHRIAERSFLVGGRALPLCARCSGMYLGIVGAWLFYSFTSRRAGGFPAKGILAVLGLFALAWAVDGLNSFMNLASGGTSVYTPSNLGRLITGTLMGIAMMSIVFPMFNQVAWVDWDTRPALGSLKKLGGLVLAGLALAGLVLTDNTIILYPLALISTGGVILLLTLIYTTMVLGFWRTNQARGWGDLWLVLTLGFVLAMLQIGLLDLGRFHLTGTWSGIHF